MLSFGGQEVELRRICVQARPCILGNFRGIRFLDLWVISRKHEVRLDRQFSVGKVYPA